MKSSGKRMKKLLRKLKLVIHDDFLVRLGEVLIRVFFLSFIRDPYPFSLGWGEKRAKLTSLQQIIFLPLWVLLLFTK